MPIFPYSKKGRDGKFVSTKPKPEAIVLEKECFPQQLSFITDPARFVTASCSRRAGKSTVCALDLIITCLSQSDITCAYITLTGSMAMRNIWRPLVRLDRKYKLGIKFNRVERTAEFENGSIIRLSGCQDASEVDKVLGQALKLVYLDEVQSFRSHIKDLVDRAIAPALMDYNGKLKLIGTPALLQAGYFWDALHNDNYSHHHWTFWDNPWIATLSGRTHREVFEDELRRSGRVESDANVRREYFGEWVNDEDARVFRYQPAVNHFDTLPDLTDYVIAVDVGYHDADAIAVIGWKKHEKTCYLVDEIVVAQQGVTELANQVSILYERYKPIKMVMDTGGLGKKIAEELRKRYTLPIVAAEKTRKIEYVELLNDALRTGLFKARRDSRFAEDSYRVEWDHDKTTPDRKAIKPDPHSDIADAVLYGFREALHWLEEPARKMVTITTREAWIEHTTKLMEESLQREIDLQDEAKRERIAYDEMFGEEGDVIRNIINQRRGR